MDFLYIVLDSVLSAVFLYYILILIFGNSKGTIPFIIYLLITVFRVIIEVITWLSVEDTPIYYPIVAGLIMLIPYAFFLFMMIRKFGLFNLRIRSRKFKHNLKRTKDLVIAPLAKRKKKILLVVGIAALIITITAITLKVTKVWEEAPTSYLFVLGLITIATFILSISIKYKSDMIIFIIGKNQKRAYIKVLSQKTKEKDLFINDEYFLDYAGLAYVKDETKLNTIYHVFILYNDDVAVATEDTVFIDSPLSKCIIDDFEKYKNKSVYYKMSADQVIKIRGE